MRTGIRSKRFTITSGCKWHRALLAGSSALALTAAASPVLAQSVAIDNNAHEIVDGNDPGGTGPGTQPSPWEINGTYLRVGEDGIGRLTVQNGGTVTSNITHIGDQNGSEGTVTISGGGSSWDINSSLSVGYDGKGTLVIADGGTVAAGHLGYIGRYGGSEGTVVVSGTDAAGNASTWTINTVLVVSSRGTGSLTIANGGQVSSSRSRIGDAPGSDGTVIVTGTDANGNASTWINSGDLNVGEDGTGSLTISNGGVVSSEAAYLGLYTAGSGMIALNSNGVLAANLVEKRAGSGTLSFDGGILRATSNEADFLRNFDAGDVTINAGGAVFDTNGFDIGIAAGLQGTGDLTKTGTGTLTLTGESAYGGDTIVEEGTLTIANGGQVSGDWSYIGLDPGSTGTVIVSGTDGAGKASTWTTMNFLDVGYDNNSTGKLIIENGGQVSSGYSSIGRGPGSDGTVIVSGTDAAGHSSALTNSGSLYAGFSGTGTLIIENGGQVSNDGHGITGRRPGSDGRVIVSGTDGAGNTSSWDNSGSLFVGENGTGMLAIRNGSQVSSAHGNIRYHGYIGYNDDAIGTVAVSGTDAAGNASTWTNDGALYIGRRGTGSLTIANGGNVRTDSATIAEQSVSAGTLNIGAAAGEGAVAAGTLDVGALNFGDGAAALNFNHTEDEYVFAAALASTGSGAHSLNHYAGTTVLTGDNSAFTGTVTISGGALLVENALGGSMRVEDGARLGGAGSLGSGAGSAVTVASAGTLAPGNSIGTLNVAGDITFDPASIYEVEINSAGESDLIHTAGTATLNGGTVRMLPFPGYALGTQYTILTADGGIAGTGFDEAVFDTDSLFITPVLSGDANNVYLMLSQTADFADAALTPNQNAAASGIQSAGPGALFNAVAALANAGNARAAFDSGSGEIHASAQTALIEDSRFIRNAANDRIRSAFAQAGSSSAPVLAYGPGAAPVLVAADHDGPAIWTHGFGSWGVADGNGNAAGIDRSTGGLLIGADTRIGDWRVGALGGYGQSQVETKGRSSSGSSNNYHLGLYGGIEWGNTAFRTGAAYTWHDLEFDRSFTVPGLSNTLSADYTASTFQAFGELGYGLDLGTGIRLEPLANLAHVSQHADGFTEQGGAAALSGMSGSTNVTFTTLGLRGEQSLALGTADAVLRGMAGWRHAFGDTAPESVHAFEAGNAFTIAGVPIARNSAVIEAGIGLNLTPGATFGLSYTGQLASEAYDHGFKANFAVRF